MLGIRFLWQFDRLLIQSTILALLTAQLVGLCVEERTPVPRIFADTQLDPLDARVGLLAHGLRDAPTPHDKCKPLI